MANNNKELSTVGIAGENESGSLQVVERNLKSYIQTGNDNALQAVAVEMRRRPGLFGIMFPGRILRENDELTVQNMKDMYKARQDQFNALVAVQIERTKLEGQMMIQSKLQGYEGQLSTQAMQIQKDLSAFSARKLLEMQETFQKSTSIFSTRIDQQTKEAETYKENPVLYDKLKQNLERETQMFFDTIEKLRNGFREALENKLNQK
jgi:hypothetical protein